MHSFFFYSIAINYCSTDNGDCDQTCDNSANPICSCLPGYILDDDEKGCSGKKKIDKRITRENLLKECNKIYSRSELLILLQCYMISYKHEYLAR